MLLWRGNDYCIGFDLIQRKVQAAEGRVRGVNCDGRPLVRATETSLGFP
jgi:hypothetical protein